MAEQEEKKKSFSVDWLARGVLTKIGDIADTFTGRGSGGTSSLATSELTERLKKMLDSEARDMGEDGRFVPHRIKLKMAWNKFSTDSPDALKAVENELTIAAIDHINDSRYHLRAPLKIEVKADYFTEGVQFVASYDNTDEVEMKVTLPDVNVKGLVPEARLKPEPDGEAVIADFSAKGKQRQVELIFEKGKRLSVGRSGENDLTIEDATISKNHASLAINAEGKLIVADTGSTNGTFINENRLAYGRAFPINEGEKVTFGTVDVFFRRVAKPAGFIEEADEIPPTEQGIKIDLSND